MQKYMRVKQVAQQLGIASSTCWRWVQSGKLPAPKKLSPRVTVWDAAEIQSSIDKMGSL